jgi:hypothetical protein
MVSEARAATLLMIADLAHARRVVRAVRAFMAPKAAVGPITRITGERGFCGCGAYF